MLQRAASNAYSWWWASHIRTKQSKWLEQNLQDVEEKVQSVLKILQEDGDSFAKRAEMYYKKRPELITFVEESYRAYRALAERYDHISRELQNANNTIAAVCPEQVQFSMDDDDDDMPKMPKKMPEGYKLNAPKVPKAPVKDLKSVITTATKKFQPKKETSTKSTSKVPRSGLTKSEALEEIDKLQKEILSLQTVKEYVKSSYENGLAKYWETEDQIKELQNRVCSLQDEFGEGIIIEDDEARRVMAGAALKSCQETLVHLQQEQEKSAIAARTESKRIRDTKKKLDSFKGETNYGQTEQEETEAQDVKQVEEPKQVDEESETSTQQKQDLQLLEEKIKEHFEVGIDASLSVTEMAEKIDELVNKVFSLETSVSSQTALVKSLRTEMDELQAQIRVLEDDKASLINDKHDLSNALRTEMDELQVLIQALENDKASLINDKHDLDKNLKEMEDKYNELQDLNQGCNLCHLSDEAQSGKPNGELGVTGSTTVKDAPLSGAKVEERLEQQDVLASEDIKHTAQKEGMLQVEMKSLQESIELEKTEEPENKHENHSEAMRTIAVDKDISQSQTTDNTDVQVVSQDKPPTKEDEPNWQQLFLTGMKDREKTLLAEYTATLRHYKDVKKKLSEVEKMAQDSIFEASKQIKELKNANDLKDEEIKLLRHKLTLLQRSMDSNNISAELKDEKMFEAETSSAIENAITEFSENETPTSAIEEKFRTEIDELLEENLDFWLKFSASFHEIQKFETEIKDLQADVLKLVERGKKSEGGSGSIKYSLKSDARPIFKHLVEIHTELTVWLEKSVMLKEELKSRFSSLCHIQEEITKALKASAEDDDFKFTSYQAAKFQGEVLNMKQENHKVSDELQAGSDHLAMLQVDIEKALEKLKQEFGLTDSKRQQNAQLTHSESRSRVPLRSFIFGVKPKKQKQSIFSYMTPAMHKKYQGFKAKHIL